MKQTALLIFILLAFNCCNSNEEQQVIDAILKISPNSTIKLGNGTILDSDKGTINFKILNIKGGEELNDSLTPDISILSMCAITFYSNLSPETMKEKDAIKIIIERNINGQKKTLEKIYYKDTLNMVIKAFNLCQKLGDSFIKSNYKPLYNQFNFSIRKNISFSDFLYQSKEIDKKAGITKTASVTSFDIKQFEEENGNKIPTVHFKLILERNSLKNSVDVEYSLPPDTISILNLNF